VLDGDPAPPKKGTAPPHSSAHVYYGHGRPYQVLLSSCCTAHGNCRRAHWRHLGNTIEHVLPWAHPNPNDKSIGSAAFAQLTAESPYIYSVRPFRQNCPFPLGDLEPHIIRDSMGQPKPTTQTVSRSVQPFCMVHWCDRQTDRQTTLLGR